MEEEKPKKKRKKAPIKREPSSSLEMVEREETRPRVKKAAKGDSGEKAHKTPWQEKYALPEVPESPPISPPHLRLFMSFGLHPFSFVIM